MYMLPMANGMDQYLANRLTNLHAVQVVTDPQRADAILTDRLGPAFEDRLQELYPPPAEEKEEAESKEAAKGPAKDAAKDDTKEKDQEKPEAPPPAFGDTANKLAKVGSMGSIGRAKGTIFLVDVKSRQVLWSIYQRPKDTTPHQLDRTAVHIVNQLKQDIAGKATAQP